MNLLAAVAKMPTDGWTPRQVIAGWVGIGAMFVLSWLATRRRRIEFPPPRHSRTRTRPARRPRVSPPPRRGALRRGSAPTRPSVNGQPRAAMPARPWLSFEYREYIAGRPPYRADGVLHPAWDGVLWPVRSAYVLEWNRQENGGWCMLGIVCGHTAQATECDHTDSSEMFHETMRTLKPVCHDCHVRREQLKDQGVDAWKWRVNQHG